VPLVEGQVGDRALLEAVLQGEHPVLAGTDLAGRPIEAVLHFAAYAYVGESVSDPAKYYRNNLGDTLTLLEALVAPERGGQPIPIVFSSTCATYGIPERVPITEANPQVPINPYGRSKWMVEQMLTDFSQAYGLPCVIFRYFNAAGADPEGDLGEDHDPETHLIPRVLDVMSGRQPYLQIFGDDYPTPDGTCIRDYIHVQDLALAHVAALKKTESGFVSAIYNVGSGNGYSVREMMNQISATLGKDINPEESPARAGDSPKLIASTAKIERELGWKPTATLKEMIDSSWAAESSNQ